MLMKKFSMPPQCVELIYLEKFALILQLTYDSVNRYYDIMRLIGKWELTMRQYNYARMRSLQW